jgi:Mn-dependent DtxR family transcriptional regulator
VRKPVTEPLAGPGPGYAADILALSRAAYDLVARALRSAPEVRANRVMARWPIDLEDLLLELEPMQSETPIHKLASRLGVSSAQLRSTALRLQRLSLVKVSSEGVSLTGSGRQKLARLEMARAAVLRRIASTLDGVSPEEAQLVTRLLAGLVDHAEDVIEEQLGEGLFRARS